MGCDKIFGKNLMKNAQSPKMSCLLQFAAVIWIPLGPIISIQNQFRDNLVPRVSLFPVCLAPGDGKKREPGWERGRLREAFEILTVLAALG